MQGPLRFVNRRGGGFSLLEALIAMTLLTVGLVSLAALVVSASRQTELEQNRQKVLEAAQNLLEEIKANDPQVVPNFDGQQYAVPGVSSGVLTVEVDSTVTALLGVVVTATWDTAGNGQNMVLETQIYNSKG